MDSFTEGTAVGSFDCLRSSCSSEHLPERSHSDPPAREIEMWREEVLMSTLPSEGDDMSYLPDSISEHSLDPALSTSWQVTPTRAPKRQLSSTSVDGDCVRGRKLSRHGRGGMPTARLYNHPLRRSLSGGDPSVDRLRSPRSSSAPSFI
jgi:hypothetical protein